MNAFERVLSSPHSIAARTALAREWAASAEPRARLIDLQLQQHRGLGPDTWDRVPDEIDDLLRRNGREWAGPIADSVVKYYFELGLVSVIIVEAQTWIDRAAELVSLAPIVGLAVNPPGDLARLALRPELQQIRSMSLLRGSWLDDDAARALAESPMLSELRFLELSGGTIGKRGVEALIASPHLKNVISIDVTGNPGVRTLGVRKIEDRDFIIGRAGEPLLQEAVAATARGYDGRVSWPPLEKTFLFDNDE